MTPDFPITKCEPGVAFGAYDLRNRGLDLQLEITCWPTGHNKRFCLSTGGRAPVAMKPMRFDEYMFCVAEFYDKFGSKIVDGERRVRHPSEEEWNSWLNEYAERRTEGKKRERELFRKFREMGEQRRIPYERIAVVNELAAFHD